MNYYSIIIVLFIIIVSFLMGFIVNSKPKEVVLDSSCKVREKFSAVADTHVQQNDPSTVVPTVETGDVARNEPDISQKPVLENTINVKVINNDKDTDIDNPNKSDVIHYNPGEVINTPDDTMGGKPVPDYTQKEKQAGKTPGYTVKRGDFGYEFPREVMACQNSSISQRYIDGTKKIVPNRIQCGQDNKLTAENYYKIHQVPRSWLEDYRMLGSNYSDYTNAVEPSNVGVRILPKSDFGDFPGNDTTPETLTGPLDRPPVTEQQYIPVGMNYVFEDTPALKRNSDIHKTERPKTAVTQSS